MSAARPSWMGPPRDYVLPCVDEVGNGYRAMTYAGLDGDGDHTCNIQFFDNRADAEAFIVGKGRIAITA